LQDTDVAGYLRIAHEQNLISTIEEGRKETQEEFYRVLEDRSQRDWEAKKKRVFEELGGRIGASDRRVGPLGKSSLSVRILLISYSQNFLTMDLGLCGRAKSVTANADKDDGIRPRHYRTQQRTLTRNVLPPRTRPHRCLSIYRLRCEFLCSFEYLLY